MHSDFDRLITGGAWRPGKSRKVLEDRNPFDGELLTEIVQAGAADLDAACAAYAGGEDVRGGGPAAVPALAAEPWGTMQHEPRPYPF